MYVCVRACARERVCECVCILYVCMHVSNIIYTVSYFASVVLIFIAEFLFYYIAFRAICCLSITSSTSSDH